MLVLGVCFATLTRFNILIPPSKPAIFYVCLVFTSFRQQAAGPSNQYMIKHTTTAAATFVENFPPCVSYIYFPFATLIAPLFINSLSICRYFSGFDFFLRSSLLWEKTLRWNMWKEWKNNTTSERRREQGRKFHILDFMIFEQWKKSENGVVERWKNSRTFVFHMHTRWCWELMEYEEQARESVVGEARKKLLFIVLLGVFRAYKKCHCRIASRLKWVKLFSFSLEQINKQQSTESVRLTNSPATTTCVCLQDVGEKVLSYADSDLLCWQRGKEEEKEGKCDTGNFIHVFWFSHIKFFFLLRALRVLCQLSLSTL